MFKNICKFSALVTSLVLIVGCQNVINNQPQQPHQPLSSIEFKLGSHQKFPDAEAYLNQQNKSIYLEKQARLSNIHILKVSEGVNEMNQPMLNLEFNENGKRILSEVTKNNLGKLIAILVDNKVISAPTILQPIDQGKVAITGIKSFDELKSMVKSIQQGITKS